MTVKTYRFLRQCWASSITRVQITQESTMPHLDELLGVATVATGGLLAVVMLQTLAAAL